MEEAYREMDDLRTATVVMQRCKLLVELYHDILHRVLN